MSNSTPRVEHPARPDWLSKVVIGGLASIGLMHFTSWWLSVLVDWWLNVHALLLRLLT